MQQISSKQIAITFSVIFILALIVIGFSPKGQRFALSFCQPFISSVNYLNRQMHMLFNFNGDKDARIAELQTTLEKERISALGRHELEEENRQLKRLLDIRQRPQWNIIHAQILTRDPAVWDLSFTLDKGLNDGIVDGAIVVVDDTVVGRVTTLNRHSAVVDTVISPKCRLSVVIEDTDVCGLLRGTGVLNGNKSPGCIVDFLPLRAEAEPGWLLKTSGLSEQLPPGLPVAMATELEDGTLVIDPDHARKQLYATPLINWDAIRFVSVLVPQK